MTEEILANQLSRREIMGSYSAAMETLLLLRKVVSGRWSVANNLINTIRKIGTRLIDAQKIEIAVGNMVRRVLHSVREEYISYCQQKTPTELQDVLEVDKDAHMEDIKYNEHSSGLKAQLIQSILDLKVFNYMDELESTQTNIANLAHEHIHSNEIILTIGKSRTVNAFLKEAARLRKFQVLVIETAPSFKGHETAEALSRCGIETTVIQDSAVFAVMSRVSKVIIGAHAVKANGGLVTTIGSLMMATAAKYHSIPVVVCAGLYKLSPLYPYDPDSFATYSNPDPVLSFGEDIIDEVQILNPIYDYVPPDLLALYITNIGAYIPTYIHHLVAESYSVEDLDLED